MTARFVEVMPITEPAAADLLARLEGLGVDRREVLNIATAIRELDAEQVSGLPETLALAEATQYHLQGPGLDGYVNAEPQNEAHLHAIMRASAVRTTYANLCGWHYSAELDRMVTIPD